MTATNRLGPLHREQTSTFRAKAAPEELGPGQPGCRVVDNRGR
jgi:hypothetical protein